MTEKLVNYNITDAVIGEMREKYLRLRIVDLQDKDGAKAVDAARRAVKAKRCEVERRRKELKADALEWGRAVDAEAKRITGLLEPIEQHLEEEETRIELEKARIAAEEQARVNARRRDEHERVMRRIEALNRVGGYTGVMTAAQMGDLSEMEFDELLDAHRERWEAAEVARKAEEKRLEQVRREQVAERERIAEERRIIEEEKRAMAAEKAAREAEERKKAALDFMIAKGEEIREVCEKSLERIEEVREIVNEELRKAATPPAELPSVIEMINEFRDHEPEFLQEQPDPVGFEIMYQRFQVHTTPGDVFHFSGVEKLFDAIGQWIDEGPAEGDTLEIMVFRMTDSQYSDLLKSVEG